MSGIRKLARRWLRPAIGISGRGIRSTLVRLRLRTFHGCSLAVSGDGNEVKFGEGCSFSDCRFRIIGRNNRLIIGDGCSFWRTTMDIVSNDSTIRIGDRTSVVGNHLGFTHFLAKGDGVEIALGRECLVSYGIEIRTTDSHSIHDVGTGTLVNPPASVQIDEHVWIAARSVILKGSRIGAGTVIGLGSVVSGEIPAGVIAVGIPARTKAEGIRWSYETPQSGMVVGPEGRLAPTRP